MHKAVSPEIDFPQFLAYNEKNPAEKTIPLPYRNEVEICTLLPLTAEIPP